MTNKKQKAEQKKQLRAEFKTREDQLFDEVYRLRGINKGLKYQAQYHKGGYDALKAHYENGDALNPRELREENEALKQELMDEKLKRMADIDTRSYETAVDELAEAHKENKEANRIKDYWHKEAMYARQNAFEFRKENEALKSRIKMLEPSRYFYISAGEKGVIVSSERKGSGDRRFIPWGESVVVYGGSDNAYFTYTAARDPHNLT